MTHDPMPSTQDSKLFISWFIIATSATLLMYYVAQYASNVPYYDDFLWGFRFINQISDQNLGLADKLHLLFSFHNEHRIFWLHLMFWLNYTLTQQLNFEWLIWVGNVALFALPFLFWKALPNYNAVPKVAWLAILVLLLWQPQAYHNIFTTYGLANQYTLLFTLASVYSLVFLPQYFVLSLSLATLASLCTGGGLVAWPLGISVLLFQGKSRLVLGWLAAMACFLGFHLLTYSTPSSVAIAPTSLWVKAVNVVLYVPTYCFSLLEFGQYGGGITKIVATAVGFVFTSLVLWQIAKQPQRVFQLRLFWKNRRLAAPSVIFLWHVVGFVLLTAFLASLKRTNPHLYDFGIPDHYRTNSQVFVGAVGLLLAHQFESVGRWWRMALVATIGFWTGSYYLTTPRLVNLSRQLRADAHNFATVGSWALFPSHVGKAYYHDANRYTQMMIQKEIFVPQKLPQAVLRKAVIVAPHRVYFDSVSQSITLAYATGSNFVLYPLNSSQSLVLPLLHTFALPHHWFQNPVLTRSTGQVKANRWFWAEQHLALDSNPTRVVNAVE